VETFSSGLIFLLSKNERKNVTKNREKNTFLKMLSFIVDKKNFTTKDFIVCLKFETAKFFSLKYISKWLSHPSVYRHHIWQQRNI